MHQVAVSPPPIDLPIPAALQPAMLEMLLRPQLSLFWGARTPTRALLAALTALAARGCHLQVFDGGNRFDGYLVARLARRLSAHPANVMARIHLSRAFTCFQLAELIEKTPGGPQPLFVLDLLATFYDESVPLRDSQRLLTGLIAHLKRLATAGPVIVGAREPQTLVKERWTLLDHLHLAADATWMLPAPADEPERQPRLFD
jgi:hypothetical protein